MERLLEPELMEDDAQARAYAEADFEAPHSRFIELFQETFGHDISGYVLDLGCGPGDISRRFVRAFPRCIVHGVDGAEAMLRYGRAMLTQVPDLQSRVELISGRLPEATLPRPQYDVVISNSLLHHLPDPQVLWQTVQRYAAPRALVFIMDLRRPSSRAEAQTLTQTYTANEAALLQRDFYNSLLAAFEPAEIEAQLQAAHLDHFEVKVVSDRHVVVSGYMP
ncbi:MAG: class I SAM-dependent methyltransferase [Armatimonadota bacterium]|nr:class I SAM-dependent methyltransferase [Armatimonadota bacterium]